MRPLSSTKLLIAILVSGFLLKISVLIIVTFNIPSLPQFGALPEDIVGDEVHYNAWAMGLLNDFSYIDISYQTVTTAPGYPFFLYVIYLFSPQNFLLVKVIQILLSTFSAYIIFNIGSYIFSRREGILASLIFTFHPYAIDQCLHLQTAQLYIFLSATSIFFLLKYHKTKTKNKIRDLFYSGVLVGLGTLTRPNLILLVPVVIAWLVLDDWKIKAILKPASVFIFAFSLAMTPWTIRNYMKYDEFIWGTAGGGANFFTANSHVVYEALTTDDPKRFHYLNYEANHIENTNAAVQKFERKYNYSRLSPKMKEKLWYNEAFVYIENNPSEFFKLVVYKVLNYLRPWLKPMAWPKKYVILSGIINVPVLVFGLGGLFLGLRNPETRNGTLLFLMYFFTGIFTHAIYSAMSRYRFYEIDIYMFIFASHLFFTLKPKFLDFVNQEKK